MFSEERVAQMAAYLLHKRGGRMAYLKLMKLLYLSDRQSMEMYGEPISGDRYVSMDKGPVLSRTLSLITGGGDIPNHGWDKWIRGERDHNVSLKIKFEDLSDLDELCRADMKAMDAIYEKYGHWNRFDLCEQTHRICPEWQDPDGSSIPIKTKDIFMALGKSVDEAEEMTRTLQDRDQLVKMTLDLR
ncbi:Panacea domain-containing protein [Yersinia sp. 2105 StPb PI]|uniref:Panacea domain-containing protein n=1 Tax=Yersinia sp. 2105 StPb PI TaxID=2507058 RepID=UPI000FFBC577|nr:Panacea domain-containing protein [Yersinia sp. 2105 StPb PI]RXA96966.1 DUF4065 domain-containing protein [Yersinia sp. 2105 StPb PI]